MVDNASSWSDYPSHEDLRRATNWSLGNVRLEHAASGRGRLLSNCARVTSFKDTTNRKRVDLCIEVSSESGGLSGRLRWTDGASPIIMVEVTISCPASAQGPTNI